MEKAPKQSKRRSVGNHIVHGLIAGLALVALSTAAWFYLRPRHPERTDSAKPSVAKKSRQMKKAVAAQGGAKPERARAAVQQAARQYASPTGTVELTKNVTPPAVLKNNFYNAVSGGRPLFRRPIFKRHSENTIGGLLAARPGERFLPVEFDDEFDEDFAKSLDEQIEVSPDDTEEDKVLKQAVKKAKQQIAEAMKAGQKPSEVVADMRDEMNRVADYRDLLQEDFDKLKETATAAKIEAYLKEANKLLDEFGAEHLDLPEDEVEMINERLENNPEGEESQETKSLVIDLPGGSK